MPDIPFVMPPNLRQVIRSDRRAALRIALRGTSQQRLAYAIARVEACALTAELLYGVRYRVPVLAKRALQIAMRLDRIAPGFQPHPNTKASAHAAR